jgi:hypothetical protein
MSDLFHSGGHERRIHLEPGKGHPAGKVAVLRLLVLFLPGWGK